MTPKTVFLGFYGILSVTFKYYVKALHIKTCYLADSMVHILSIVISMAIIRITLLQADMDFALNT